MQYSRLNKISKTAPYCQINIMLVHSNHLKVGFLTVSLSSTGLKSRKAIPKMMQRMIQNIHLMFYVILLLGVTIINISKLKTVNNVKEPKLKS